MPHIGVDIGGTAIKIGIADSEGIVFRQTKIATEPVRGSRAIVQSIIESIDRLLAASEFTRKDVDSIGLGVPGTTDDATGSVLYAPNLAWRNVRIVPDFEACFCAPVHLVQDTRAAAWAEHLIGAGRGLGSVAAVTLGTGIGCGLVLDGKLYKGPLNTAGELGHQIVVPGGVRCNCGRRGCLEAYAGGLGILRQAAQAMPSLAAELGKAEREVSVADIFDQAEAGDRAACALVQSTVEYIGIGLVALINLCSVEMIALSGGISNAPRGLLLDPQTKFVRDNAYTAIADRVQICRSPLGEDAPLAGAALLNCMAQV